MSTKKKMTKKQRRRKKIIIFAIEIILLLVLLVGVFIWSKLNKIEKTDLKKEDVKVNELDETTKELLQGYTNIAVFGLDNRSNGSFESGNSDVIMIASIDNDSKEVKLVSIYRDSYLNIGDNTYRKVNAAFAKGGVKNAIETLNTNLDLDISQYVVVDFNAVSDAIDLLGGVEIQIEQEEVELLNSYTQTTAEVTGKQANYISGPGLYTLDGTQATGYARIRYTAGDDYRRTERQRTVVEQMVKKAKSADLSTLNSIIDKVCDEVETNMANTTILGLASSIMDYEMAGTHGWPFELNTEQLGGKKGDVVVPTDLVTNVSELHRYLFNETNYVPSNTVQNYSKEISYETGYTVNDTVRRDNPFDEEEGADSTESGSTDSGSTTAE